MKNLPDHDKKVIQEAIDAFNFYLKNKKQLKFLSFVESLKREDNGALIESIQKGVYAIMEGIMDDIGANEPYYRKYISEGEKITPEEIEQAFAQIHSEKLSASDKRKARDKIVQSTYRMLFKLAEKVSYPAYKAKGQEVGSMVANNVMGAMTESLMKAIPAYDPSKGAKFSTFVYPGLLRAARRSYRKSLGIPEVGIWKPGKQYKKAYFKTSSDEGKAGTLRPSAKVLHKPKEASEYLHYYRVGDENIPENELNTPPDASPYWEERAEESGDFATERTGGEVQKGGAAMDEKAKTELALAKQNEPSPERQISIDDALKNIDEIVDAFVGNMSAATPEEEKENLKAYFKERIRLEVERGKTLTGKGKEDDPIKKELLAKHNIRRAKMERDYNNLMEPIRREILQHVDADTR